MDEKQIKELVPKAPVQCEQAQSLENFDITDLSVEEVQYQERKLKAEKLRKRSLFTTKTIEEVELTEREKEFALQMAIGQRDTDAYFRSIYREKIEEKHTAEQLFELFKSQYTITDNRVISLLCYYFANDKRFEKHGYSLSKGILLYGNIGCGKTTLMRFFQKVRYFQMRSVKDVAAAFAENGHGALAEYRKGVFCFDDYGIESEQKHYGVALNAMQDIILSRYDYRLITHLTTNINADDMREMYGERVTSRLREMCNIIQFSPDAKDLRK